MDKDRTLGERIEKILSERMSDLYEHDAQTKDARMNWIPTRERRPNEGLW